MTTTKHLRLFQGAWIEVGKRCHPDTTPRDGDIRIRTDGTRVEKFFKGEWR